jgi:hypothetical protein
MNRRYGLLAALLVVAALLLSFVVRLPRHAPTERAVPAATPETALVLAVREGRLDPERVSVPKGHRVALTVVNHDRAPVSLSLGGYQDRVRIDLAPGATWRGSFVADLPGDDFAWISDGRPVGVLRVTGSHLEDGHR